MSAPHDPLAAVLVCHRSWPTTASAARALAAGGVDPARVIVVDSGSGDGSAERLRRLLPASPVLARRSNDGFAAAANAGVDRALADGAAAVLVLNPDILFADDLPGRLVERLASCRHLAGSPAVALAPVLCPLAGPGRPFAGARATRIPGRWRRRRRRPSRPPSPQAPPPPPARVDVLWATCLLIGAEAWRRTGPFDPGFFLYYEDIDWCDRAGAAGVGLYVADDTAVWHAGAHTTGGRDGVVRRRHMARSAVRYHRARGAGPTRPRGAWVAAALAATAIGLAARGRWRALAAHARGVRDGNRSP